jgi:oligopeptide transport system permease protein
MTEAVQARGATRIMPKGRSQAQAALRRLMRNRAAVASLFVLAFIVLACFAGPYLIPHDAETQDWDNIGAPARLAGGHWLGTDEFGRDFLARVLQGGQISLWIGLVATLVSVVIGVLWGAVAGYVGGITDSVMMRIVDILYSMPFMFFVIMLTMVFGQTLFTIFLAIGAVQWLTIAVIVRGQTLSLKQREFIEAARAGGSSSAAIILQHIIPNTMSPVIVYASLTVPEVILGESFLSFLGLGVQEPRTSWGVLIEEGAVNMATAPWLLVYPGLFLAATLFSLNFIADGLRDAFDPKDR